MKKTFIIGMTLAFSVSAFAAPGKMTTTERLAKFDKSSQEYFLDANGNLKNATGKNAERKYLEQAVRDIAPGKEAKIVENAMSDKEVLKNLVSASAAKKASEKMEDRAEAKQIQDAAEGITSMIGEMHLSKKAESRELSKEESAIATAAFEKSIKLGTDILTKFQGADRASYARVLASFKELAGNGKLPSENLVEAVRIAQGKGGAPISKEKALEILKKLKDCV